MKSLLFEDTSTGRGCADLTVIDVNVAFLESTVSKKETTSIQITIIQDGKYEGL